MNIPNISDKLLPLFPGNAKVVAVSSGQPGVGKSNLIASLGITLASRGKRVCLIETDSNQDSISNLLNVSSPNSLEQVLSGEQQIEDILDTGLNGLRIVPAASAMAEFTHLKRPQQERLLIAIKRLEYRFDYLLIDTAASTSGVLLDLLQAACHRIVLVTTELHSLTSAFSHIKALKIRGLSQPVSIVVNMAPSTAQASAAYMRLKRAVATHLALDVRLLGVILPDPELKCSVAQQKHTVLSDPSSVVGRCTQSISNRLELYLQHHKVDDAHFSTLLAERLNPVIAKKPNTEAEGEWEAAIESVRRYMQADESGAEETEALLLELTLAWVARFGAAPSTLRDLLGGEKKEGDTSQIETMVGDHHAFETPLEDEDEESGPYLVATNPQTNLDAGLLQAMHSASLLADSEAP